MDGGVGGAGGGGGGGESGGGRCYVNVWGFTLHSSIIKSRVGFKPAAASSPVGPSHRQLLILFVGTG